jgi:hypothetical protein
MDVEVTPNPLLNTHVGADSATESLLEKGRELIAAFKAWKAEGCPLDADGLRPIESLANKISRQTRELQNEVGNTPGRSGDELLPFVLDLITETRPDETDKGGLLVYLPNDKKDWLPKNKIEYNIIEYPERKSDDRPGKRGRVEVQIPRWLAMNRGMI